jgi:tRNA(Ile)-lysidine synthase
MQNKGLPMIKMLGNIPQTVAIAVSGGPDSMAVLDFLSRSKRDILVLYFNHGTDHAKDAEQLVSDYCNFKNIPYSIGNISRDKYKNESQEEYWRNERYSFFFNWCNYKIVTCHHLDDAVETWIFTSLHGNPMLIPYKRDNFIRPFLTTRKNDFINWCNNKNTPHIIDPSNSDTIYMRNFIRHTLMPKALIVNPGLHKVVKKKILEQYKKTVDVI